MAAKRRRAPKVWRTASGQMMQRTQPAYIPPEQMPAILQLGMFNVAHDGDAALALPADPEPEPFTPVAVRAAVEAVPIAPDAPIIIPEAERALIAAGKPYQHPTNPDLIAIPMADGVGGFGGPVYMRREDVESVSPVEPDPEPEPGYNQPGQGLAIIDAVMAANPIDTAKLEQIADAQAAADQAAAAKPVKVKKLRKNANIAAMPQVWPDDPPPGYIVKMVHGTCYQPVRLSDPDHPDGIYFVLVDPDADGFSAKYCSTAKAAIEWLWCVALGKALAAAAEGVRAACTRAAEAASAAEHGTDSAPRADRPPAKRRRSSKPAS